jgi:hypothetical protein
MTIYLYVKQHLITRLKYFGVTRLKDPYKYLGSGKHWVPHIKKHGKEFIETIELWGFDNQEEATDFALKFSEENNIVESKEWANLCVENAKDGGLIGKATPEETKRKQSEAAKNRPPISEETRKRIGESSKGRICSEETKQKMSKSLTGKRHSEETKLKLSMLKKGIKFSDEHKNKLSKSQMGNTNKKGKYKVKEVL